MTRILKVEYAQAMLYRFHSKNSPDCLMLQDLSERIFKVMHRELTKEGILLVEQLPGLIACLEEAIEQDVELRSEANQDGPQVDRLGQRAFPFLALLRSALKKQDPVVWGY